jgi:hypothetical protein
VLRAWSLAALLLVAAGAAAAATLPAAERPLDAACGETVRSVAWTSDGELLLASRNGVRRYSVASGRCTPLFDLPHVAAIATDGESAVALGLPITVHAARIADGAKLFTHNAAEFRPIDIAVHRDRLYVFGFYTYDTKTALPSPSVWRGELTSDWSNLTPVHRVTTREAFDVVHDAFPGRGAALAVEADGTLDVVSEAEPGVFRYRADGTPLPPLGISVRDLVLARFAEMRAYRKDVSGRYRDILNRQPTIDDLVVTPDGPAIVVRLVDGDRIHWQLWYPNATTIAARVDLAATLTGSVGHIRCDARAARLACVLEQPVDDISTRTRSLLVFYELPKVRVR